MIVICLFSSWVSDFSLISLFFFFQKNSRSFYLAAGKKFRSSVEVIGDLITIGFLRIGCIGFLTLFAEDCENFSNLV